MSGKPDIQSTYEETGRRISERRRQLSMTQAALSRLVGVAQSTLADWERGKTRPRPGALDRLCAALRCYVWQLIPEYTPPSFVEGEPPLPKGLEDSEENVTVHRTFLKMRVESESDDQLYLRLFEFVSRFIEEMYSAPGSADFRTAVFAGSVGTSRVRQAVLLTKRVWEDALRDKSPLSMADRVFKALEAYQATMRHFLGITVASDVITE